MGLPHSSVSLRSASFGSQLACFLAARAVQRSRRGRQVDCELMPWINQLCLVLSLVWFSAKDKGKPGLDQSYTRAKISDSFGYYRHHHVIIVASILSLTIRITSAPLHTSYSRTINKCCHTPSRKQNAVERLVTHLENADTHNFHTFHSHAPLCATKAIVTGLEHFIQGTCHGDRPRAVTGNPQSDLSVRLQTSVFELCFVSVLLPSSVCLALGGCGSFCFASWEVGTHASCL